MLYPFAPREELSNDVIVEARAFFAAREPIEFSLTRISAWPTVVYAVPEPDAALRECMQALSERFPAWPPYGGLHAEVVPHATLGEDVDAARVAAEIEQRLTTHLPRRYKPDAVTLLEEFASNEWRPGAQFPFGGH